MSSYTAQLFESLKRSAAAATPEPSRQLGYTFSVPEVDSVTPYAGAFANSTFNGIGNAERERLQARGALLGSQQHASVRTASSVAQQLPPQFSAAAGHTSVRARTSGGGGEPPAQTSAQPLPQELEDCYAVIRSQRNQIAQLRERTSALEEQVTNYRDRVLGHEMNAGAQNAETSSLLEAKEEEIGTLRSTIEVQAAEMARLRDERSSLMKKLMESQKQVDSVRAAAEKDRNELAFKLGKEVAAASALLSPAPSGVSATSVSTVRRPASSTAATVAAGKEPAVAPEGVSSPPSSSISGQREASASAAPGSAAAASSSSLATGAKSRSRKAKPASDDEEDGVGEEGEGREEKLLSRPAPKTRESKEARRDAVEEASGGGGGARPKESWLSGNGIGGSGFSIGKGLIGTPLTYHSSSLSQAAADIETNAYLARQDQLRAQEAVLQSLRQQQGGMRPPTAISSAIGASVLSLPFSQPSSSSAHASMATGDHSQPMMYGGAGARQFSEPPFQPGQHQRGVSTSSSAFYMGSPTLAAGPHSGTHNGMMGGGAMMMMGGQPDAGAFPQLQEQQHQQQQVPQPSNDAYAGGSLKPTGVTPAPAGFDPAAMQAAFEFFTAQQQQQQAATAAAAAALQKPQIQLQPSRQQKQQQRQQQRREELQVPALPSETEDRDDGEAEAAAAAAAAVAAGSSQEEGEGEDTPAPGVVGPEMPVPGSRVSMVMAEAPPPGGWTVYRFPPEGTKWPTSILFYQPLVELGIPIIKHGRKGSPHKRLLWLDIAKPGEPTLVWHDGDVVNPQRIKQDNRLRLVDIEDARSGISTDVLRRSGRPQDEHKYLSLSFTEAAGGGSLDIEMPTKGARDWLFSRLVDMFQAYATASQVERLQGDDVTVRVNELLDGPAHAAVRAAATALDRARERVTGGAGGGGNRRGRGNGRSGGGQAFDSMAAMMQPAQGQQFGVTGTVESYGGGQSQRPIIY